MGFAKERMLEQQDQGWSYSDEEVCWRCITQPYLRQFVKDNATGFTCSFCKRTSRTGPSTIESDELMTVINAAVKERFGHVNDVGLFYDNEDGRYAGTTYSMEEILLWEIEPAVSPIARDPMMFTNKVPEGKFTPNRDNLSCQLLCCR
jgi:hypothetical protein